LSFKNVITNNVDDRYASIHLRWTLQIIISRDSLSPMRDFVYLHVGVGFPWSRVNFYN